MGAGGLSSVVVFVVLGLLCTGRVVRGMLPGWLRVLSRGLCLGGLGLLPLSPVGPRLLVVLGRLGR